MSEGAPSPNVAEAKAIETNVKSFLKKLEAKWEWLKTEHGFRRAPVRTLVRLISWRARCLLQSEIVIKLRRWNLKMSLPTRPRVMGEYIYPFRENYEPELAYLEEALSPGGVFLDVGANIGIYTLVASRIVGGTGRVVAFEPSNQSFPGLQRNVALNSLTNVIALRTALGEKVGRTRLYHALDPVANSLRGDPSWGGESEEISIETLDHVIEQVSIRRVHVIKIDAEGSEELVLRGARQILTAMRPLVIFEVNPEVCARLGLSPTGAREFLENLGYKFRVLQNNHTFFRPRLPRPYFNVVATPGHP
jgi:FkbM family methyltransferase